MNLAELNSRFSTDDRCRELLIRLRWPEGVTCPRCKSRTISRLFTQGKFECADCCYQFSVTAGTVFHDSHLPLSQWFLATHLLCEAKKGMSACQVQRTIGVSYKTAWYLCHRIRAAMVRADKPMLDGTVEMDETYIGGVKQGGHGPHASEKEIVVGIRQRGGDLRFYHVKNTKSKTLAKYIKNSVSIDVNKIITDDWSGYPKAMIKAGIHGERHKTINHSAKVYVIGDIHTNTVENAFSLLKRGMMGTWHHISAKHLAAYLEEMEFRFNRRKNSDLFIDTLRHMITAPALTFEKLTA